MQLLLVSLMGKHIHQSRQKSHGVKRIILFHAASGSDLLSLRDPQTRCYERSFKEKNHR